MGDPGSMPTKFLLRHWRRLASVAGSLTTFAVLMVVMGDHMASVQRVWTHASAAVLVASVALALLSLLARTEAIVHSLEAIGTRPPRSVIHAANGLTFLAVAINHFVASPVRAWLLRRIDPQRAPTIPQMVLVDASTTAIEGLCVVLLVIISAGTLHLPWWTTPTVVFAAVAATVLVTRGGHRMSQHRAFRGLAVLGHFRHRSAVAGLLAGVTLSQVLRTLLVLHVAGLHASVTQAVATFLVSGVLSTLLVGPSTGAAAAPIVVFGHHSLAAAGVAGLLLSGTALLAALVFATVAAPIYVWRIRTMSGFRLDRTAAQSDLVPMRVSGTSIL